MRVVDHVMLNRREFFQCVGVAGAALTVPRSAAALVFSPECGVAERRYWRPTRLEMFLKTRGIKPAHLARECGYSRPYLLRVRFGRLQPTWQCVRAVTAACRRLSREPVLPRDLFARWS
jgi:hypothetical protein